MAFRLEDFGIPTFDTNVNVLYKNAVEYGKSKVYGDVEYIVHAIGDTPAQVVLDFSFEADGQTPKAVVAHTWLENPVRWQERVQVLGENEARITMCGLWLKAELVNGKAGGKAFSPMLYANKLHFGASLQEVGASVGMPQGQLFSLPDGEVGALARIHHIQPIVTNQLWLFSVIELALEDTMLYMPVARDILEKQLSACNEGGWCLVEGRLSLLRTWE